MFPQISGPREGWAALLLAGVVVTSPALSLADAAWAEGLWVVPYLALFSLLLGMVLAKLPVRGVVAHLFAGEVGLVGVGFYFAAQAPVNDWEGRFLWLGSRIWAWLEIAFGGGMSNDILLFTFSMALVAWLLGYLTSWFTFRRQNVWPPLILCGLALLLNLSYGAPDPLLYFVPFLMAAMLLLVRITLSQKEVEWVSTGGEHGRGLAGNSLGASVPLVAAILIFAWALPAGSVNAAVAESWFRVTAPWQDLQSEFDRLFASIGSAPVEVDGNRFTKTLALKGAIKLGTEPVMVVSSPMAEYWGAQSYDRYTGHGWMSTADETTRLDANDEKLARTSLYRGRLDVEQRFKLLAGRMGSVFAATSPVKLSLDVYADHFDSLEELATLRAAIPLRAGQQYAVISSISVATADQLRRAGGDYPAWTERYLELPGRSAARVANLARRLTRDSDSMYDAALILQEYLRRFPYDVQVETPPTDRDAVDWFLFTAKVGYCDYFASAMAVMARTIGIPSRLVSGYNTGILNEQTGLYEIRQQNAHSWPELFFPSYGWVRFEPTPSQPAPERPLIALGAAGPVEPIMEAGSLAPVDLDLGQRDRLLYIDDFDLGGDVSTNLLESGQSGRDDTSHLVVPVIVIAVLLSFWLIWRLVLGRLSPSERSYLQMYWIAGLFGWRLRASHTPAEYARLLGTASAELGPQVKAVAQLYAEGAYGGSRPEVEARAELSWLRVRWKLVLRLVRLVIERKLTVFRLRVGDRGWPKAERRRPATGRPSGGDRWSKK